MLPNVAETIKNQIGLVNLVCFGAKNMRGVVSDDATHDGYFEFMASNNPKIAKPVLVRVELAFNDTYTVKIFDGAELVEEVGDVYCDALSQTLFEVLG